MSCMVVMKLIKLCRCVMLCSVAIVNDIVHAYGFLCMSNDLIKYSYIASYTFVYTP